MRCSRGALACETLRRPCKGVPVLRHGQGETPEAATSAVWMTDPRSLQGSNGTQETYGQACGDQRGELRTSKANVANRKETTHQRMKPGRLQARGTSQGGFRFSAFRALRERRTAAAVCGVHSEKRGAKLRALIKHVTFRLRTSRFLRRLRSDRRHVGHIQKLGKWAWREVTDIGINGSVAHVRRCLSQSRSPGANWQDRRGNTLLMNAVRAKNRRVYRYLLLERGDVDIGLMNRRSETALIVALRSGDSYAVELLSGRGAVEDAENKRLFPLHVLCESEETFDIVALATLLLHGARLNGVKWKVGTVLDAVVSRGQRRLAFLLYALGALSAVTKTGQLKLDKLFPITRSVFLRELSGIRIAFVFVRKFLEQQHKQYTGPNIRRKRELEDDVGEEALSSCCCVCKAHHRRQLPEGFPAFSSCCPCAVSSGTKSSRGNVRHSASAHERVPVGASTLHSGSSRRATRRRSAVDANGEGSGVSGVKTPRSTRLGEQESPGSCARHRGPGEPQSVIPSPGAQRSKRPVRAALELQRCINSKVPLRFLEELVNMGVIGTEWTLAPTGMSASSPVWGLPKQCQQYLLQAESAEPLHSGNSGWATKTSGMWNSSFVSPHYSSTASQLQLCHLTTAPSFSCLCRTAQNSQQFSNSSFSSQAGCCASALSDQVLQHATNCSSGAGWDAGKATAVDAVGGVLMPDGPVRHFATLEDISFWCPR